MQSWIVASLMLLFSTPLLATDSLDCSGDAYSLSMSVGSDNIVDSAMLTDVRTKRSVIYRIPEIENRKLVWVDNEGDFSANRLEIVLRGEHGATYIIEAKGKKGALRHQKEAYKLDCNWER